MKRSMTKQEEFEIMKLVLDKFLWVGVLLLGFGFYRLITDFSLGYGLFIMGAGAIVLVLFMIILVRQYTFMK